MNILSLESSTWSYFKYASFWNASKYMAADLVDSLLKIPAAAADFRGSKYAINETPAVEIATINEVRNSAAQGGTAGTPGSPPTNWAFINGAGVTRTVAFGTENGMEYTQVRIVGTLSDANGFIVRFEGNTQVPAVSGEVWTGSVYVSLVGGSVTNFTAIRANTFERDSGGAYTNSQNTDIKGVLTSTPQRFSQTRTLSGTAAYVQHELSLQANSGAAVDITFRVYAPQLEKSSTLTSYVRTTGTRKQRVLPATMSTASFSDLFTFTRGSTGSYIDSDGSLKVASVNSPRFDYTNGKRQLLLEGASTNTVPNSEFNGGGAGVWNSSGTGNTATIPFNMPWPTFGTGNTGYYNIEFSTDSKGRRRMRFSGQIINATGATQYPRIRFNSLTTGFADGEKWSGKFGYRIISSNQAIPAYVEAGYASGTQASALTLTADNTDREFVVNGWTIPSITTTNLKLQLGPSMLTGTTWNFDFEVWCPQLEKIDRCTSYIPTTSTAATRSVDSCQFSPKLLALLNRLEVGVIVRAQGLWGSGGRFVGGQNVSRVIGLNTPQTQIGTGGASFQNTINVTTPLPAFGAAVSYGSAGRTMSYNSAAVLATAAVMDNMPMTSAFLGKDSATAIANGWYDELIIYPFRPNNTTLQSLAVTST